MRAQWNMKCPSFKLSYNFLFLSFFAVGGVGRGGGQGRIRFRVCFFLFFLK